MKKILLKTFATMLFVFATSFFTHVQAQNNSIEEVKLNSNDGFGELRKLVISNFDFTNPNLSEGVVNSNIKFSVSDSGKIVDVHAEGGCKYVSAELENVLNHLLYRFSTDSRNKNMLAATYVMPVQVKIGN